MSMLYAIIAVVLAVLVLLMGAIRSSKAGAKLPGSTPPSQVSDIRAKYTL